MIEVALAVVDECGDVVAWVSDVGEEEAEKMIQEHEEWYYKCFDCGGLY